MADKNAPKAPQNGDLPTLDDDQDGGKGANSVPPAKDVPEPIDGANSEAVNEGTGLAIANDVPGLENLVAGHLIPGFDPEKHAVNDDGSPRLKQDGSFASKRGRKPGATSSGGGGSTKKVIAAQITPETYQMAAIPLVMMYEQIGMAIGPEWKMDDAEKDMHVGAWGNYLKSKGMVDLPPGTFLAIVMVSYAGSRLMVSNTQSKLAKLVAGSKLGWLRVKAMFGR